MKKICVLVLAAATAMVLAVGGGSAMAVAPVVQQCEADGGTYTKNGPNAGCVYPETTKDVNGNAFGTATQTTDTGHGNLNNRPDSECTGNQGQCKKQ